MTYTSTPVVGLHGNSGIMELRTTVQPDGHVAAQPRGSYPGRASSLRLERHRVAKRQIGDLPKIREACAVLIRAFLHFDSSMTFCRPDDDIL